MSRRKINPKPKHKQIRRERDPLPWKYCFLTVLCGLILLAGFFGAARQHFASIEYGIKNSKLRKQIEELKTENRSLINARETALAPLEIMKAAKKYGFTDKAQPGSKNLPAETKADTPEKESVRDLIAGDPEKDTKTEKEAKSPERSVKNADKSLKNADKKDKKGTEKSDKRDETGKAKTAKK